MEVIIPILEFFQSILTQPAWIMGLFAFVGLVALKRPGHKIMTGTLKPILGYLMLSAGSTVVQDTKALGEELSKALIEEMSSSEKHGHVVTLPGKLRISDSIAAIK